MRHSGEVSVGETLLYDHIPLSMENDIQRIRDILNESLIYDQELTSLVPV